MRRTLQGYHPAVTLCYWLLVMVLSMILMQPVCLALSLLCGVGCAIAIGGKRNLKLQLKMMLPLMLLTALLNPLFSHQGITILWYFPTGNPLTLESIWFGLASGAMLGAMVCWFLCLSGIETADRLTCLFGRLIPVLSLLLSMILRYVPRLRQQFGVVHAARISAEGKPHGMIPRLKQAGTEVTAMIGWSMEHAIHTADAMKSRGYGLPGRTAFTRFPVTKRDIAALTVMGVLAAAVIIAMVSGALEWEYTPITIGVWTPATAAALCAYGLLCALPLLAYLKEVLLWRSLQSKI